MAANLVAAQSIGLLAQLICGWTVIAGCSLMFFYGGCDFTLHLLYYSGSLSENFSVAMPTAAMAFIVLAFVVTGPANTSYGYFDLGRWGATFWVLVSAVIGMISCKIGLDLLGVKAPEPHGERRPLTIKNSEP